MPDLQAAFLHHIVKLLLKKSPNFNICNVPSYNFIYTFLLFRRFQLFRSLHKFSLCHGVKNNKRTLCKSPVLKRHEKRCLKRVPSIKRLGES